MFRTINMLFLIRIAASLFAFLTFFVIKDRVSENQFDIFVSGMGYYALIEALLSSKSNEVVQSLVAGRSNVCSKNILKNAYKFEGKLFGAVLFAFLMLYCFNLDATVFSVSPLLILISLFFLAIKSPILGLLHSIDNGRFMILMLFADSLLKLLYSLFIENFRIEDYFWLYPISIIFQCFMLIVTVFYYYMRDQLVGGKEASYESEYRSIQNRVFIASSLKGSINSIDIFLLGLVNLSVAGEWATLKKIFSPMIILSDFIAISQSNKLIVKLKDNISIIKDISKLALVGSLLSFLIYITVYVINFYANSLVNLDVINSKAAMYASVYAIFQFSFAWWTKYFSICINPNWSVWAAIHTLVLYAVYTVLEDFFQYYIYFLFIIIIRSSYWLWKLYKYENNSKINKPHY